MLTLDKVQLLEERIEKAVSLIQKLRKENSSLHEEIEILKMHNDELKDFAKSLGNDTQLIEESISKALVQLEYLDDSPVETASTVNSAGTEQIKEMEYEVADTPSSPESILQEEDPMIIPEESPQDDYLDDTALDTTLLIDDEDIPLY